MKRSRMICCGGKSSTDDGSNTDKRRPPCPQPMPMMHMELDENRGAHNKYDARPRSLSSSAHHHHHHHHNNSHHHHNSHVAQDSARSVDMSDLTITLPGMVSGVGSTSSNNHHHHHHHHQPPHTHRASLSSEYSIHSHPSELKPVTKREKARQKLTNSLKRAKVLLSDRTPTTSAGQIGSAGSATGTNGIISANNTGVVVSSSIGSNSGVPGFKAAAAAAAAAQQGLSVERFKVVKLKAAIDKKPTSVDERSTAVLKYRTPHFRAVAHVEVPSLRENQSVQIGWIQACTEMRFINSYGPAGATSWEFPEIVSGKYKMIGDADGKQYPWYGSKLELQTVYGPSAQQNVTVHMNDNFFPQVTWYVPHPEFDKTPRLSHIHRKQKFYTFLVVKNLQTEEHTILNTIEWSMELNIEVDSAQPLGKRARLIGPFEQPQPVVLAENNIPLEPYALAPPNANNAQTLIWRPSDSEPKMIVPPVESTMEMDKYLQATRNFSFVIPHFDGNGVKLV